jgi:phytoene dehydrogenase-like protein
VRNTGLCAAGLLARYGKGVIVCESHTIAGGAAHSFRRGKFEFDSGPSFYPLLTQHLERASTAVKSKVKSQK